MAKKEYGRVYVEQGHTGINLLHLREIVNEAFEDAQTHGLHPMGIRFKIRELTLGKDEARTLPMTQIYWRALKEEGEG